VFKEQLMYYESDGLLNEYMELYTKVTGTEMPSGGSRETCPTCNGEIGEFRDEISVREHGISGMCQNCQDSVFGR
jgi:DnaJ-class molecular chaperone